MEYESTPLFMKKILMISSGGGHLTELLQLKEVFSKYDYKIITEKTKTTSYLKKEDAKTSYLLYGTQDHLIPYLFIFPINIVISFFYFILFRPDVVVTTGTHTAVPMCFIAHLFKKKVVFIETFANSKTPTKAGRMVYKIADLFIVQWEEMLKYYPNAEYWGWIF